MGKIACDLKSFFSKTKKRKWEMGLSALDRSLHISHGRQPVGYVTRRLSPGGRKWLAAPEGRKNVRHGREPVGYVTRRLSPGGRKWMAAPEGRKDVATGVSPWLAVRTSVSQPRRGVRFTAKCTSRRTRCC